MSRVISAVPLGLWSNGATYRGQRRDSLRSSRIALGFDTFVPLVRQYHRILKTLKNRTQMISQFRPLTAIAYDGSTYSKAAIDQFRQFNWVWDS